MALDNSEKIDDARYQKLWDEAVATKQFNVEFGEALESLVESVKTDVLPVEIELGNLLKQVLHKQLAFSKRRTLSQQHRSDLHIWMEETMHYIKEMGMADSETREKMDLAHAEFKNIPIDHESDLTISEQVDQFYAQRKKNTDEDEDQSDSPLTDQEYQTNTETADAVDSQDQLSDHPDFGLKDEFQSELDVTVLDDTVFQRLFRKTANALHPDKEPDSELRERKQRLMIFLLESRKNYDLISLLELYAEYVCDPLTLSIEDKRSLATVLYYFIEQEKQSLDKPIYQSGLHAGVYRRFYTGVKTDRIARIKSYLTKLNARREAYSHFANDVNTVFKLGSLLDRRREQNIRTIVAGTNSLDNPAYERQDADSRVRSVSPLHE